jgi:hypothetical protein
LANRHPSLAHVRRYALALAVCDADGGHRAAAVNTIAARREELTVAAGDAILVIVRVPTRVTAFCGAFAVGNTIAEQEL